MSASVIDFNQPNAVKDAGGDLAAVGLALEQRIVLQPIASLADLEDAVRTRTEIGAFVKRVQEYFAPLKAMAHKLHKALCDRERQLLDPLERLDVAKRNAISAYKVEQDRVRREQERVLQEQARREAEAQAAAEAARYELAGEKEMAAAVLDEAIATPPMAIVLPDETKQVEGLRFRRRFCWCYAGGPQEVDRTPPEVIARTLELIPRQYLTIDEPRMWALARAAKGTAKVPGIVFFHVDDPVR
jgi:hypothetical protein